MAARQYHWAMYRATKVTRVWQHFKSTFLELWSDRALHAGESYKRSVYPEEKDLQEAQTRYMERLWKVRASACFGDLYTRGGMMPLALAGLAAGYLHL